MLNEMQDKSATCPKCGYTYEGRFEMHRQDVAAVIEDGACTWCYAFSVETKEAMNPVAFAASKTLQAMGF